MEEVAHGLDPARDGASPQSRATLWIAVAGALAYTSWPLAFIVNPPLAGSALASSFEARDQPFAWLFILLDCVAGLCAAIVCARGLRVDRRSLQAGGALVVAFLAYALFGTATAVDAVVPLDCGSASAQECASRLWPLTPDDLLTGTAVFGLFVAALAVLVHALRRPAAVPRRMPATIVLTLAVWGALGSVVLVWSSSAVLAAVCQYAFLTLTGVLAFLVPFAATRRAPAVERESWPARCAALLGAQCRLVAGQARIAHSIPASSSGGWGSAEGASREVRSPSIIRKR